MICSQRACKRVIPTELGADIPSRDFVPWRFSDAGCPSVWMASLSRRPRNLHRSGSDTHSTPRPLLPRLCCKSLFASLVTKFPSCRRDFRINIWGITSPGDELTGDFGNELEAISIGNCGLFRLLARILSHGILGLLQHNHPDSRH